MRLLSLDYDPVYGEATRATFAGDFSAFDYDVVIWDPAESLRFYATHSDTYRGLPCLAEGISVRIQADADRRANEFREFIRSGRTLVVISRPPQLCYIDTGQREHSGTGRNRITTNMVSLFDLLSALPCEVNPSRARGSRIEFVGDGPIVGLLRKYKEYLAYKAVLSRYPGTAVARVTGTDRVVSSIDRREDGGYLILLPVVDLRLDEEDVEDEEGEEDEDLYIEEAPTFQADLLEAISQLVGSATHSRPTWMERYSTTREEQIQQELTKQQKRVESARNKLAKLQQQKEAAEARDQLFLGSGRALEVEVGKVLEALGGIVIEPDPGRDDWKVAFPEGNAVVEVKGVGKSAAEKHAAQLEKWVAAELEATGKAPKGILVVNAWRELPLDERVQDAFPSQMLPYCESRGHCLITGLQLFVILADLEEDSSRADKWRKALLGTCGKLAGADDWRSVIHETKPAPVQEGDAEA
ncbi:hypothetical protein [Actinomadura sp. NPDC048394]|uniref:hypothetical protein n=1 Tax=Actinomadura sp. NPDC048394 TaxID=3158223 RepID=UPI0033FAA757